MTLGVISPAAVAAVPVLRFHDVAHYQSKQNADGTWRYYTPTGPTFCKATEGRTYTDPTFAEIRRRTLAGGWTFVAYHYVTTDDPEAQARHALAVIGKTTPVMWDVEKGGGTLAHLLAVHDWYVKLGGLATLVYLPKWYWQGYMGSPSLAPLKARGLALVSSNYPRAGYTANGPGWSSYGGMVPSIWQYTSTPLDTDAFRGTEGQLAALVGARRPAPLPAPRPAPAPKPVHTVVHGDTLASIAAGWDVTLRALEAANPHAGHPAGHFDNIWPGDVIHHP